ncbi:hypothetical protein F0562_005880 [Nyssa sinensis]|uniref:Uncharacterized protein n=1 Tax=Nyssa sinensis TaxID=561372 RepID=A0A5J5AND9_9ASTE|nr:hypothetical protein F0562_005880 [Nyssa sinensis]
MGRDAFDSYGSSVYQQSTNPVTMINQAHSANVSQPDTSMLLVTKKVVSELLNQVLKHRLVQLSLREIHDRTQSPYLPWPGQPEQHACMQLAFLIVSSVAHKPSATFGRFCTGFSTMKTSIVSEDPRPRISTPQSWHII